MSLKLSDAELLAKLVAFDSTSVSSNLPIADFICAYLDRPGVEIVRNPNGDGTKTNLIIRVGPDETEHASRRRDVPRRTRDSARSVEHDSQTHGTGLILSGHLDVVPALEPDWRTDPFSLSETDDAYFGRGTCDMKGFVALAVNSAHAAASQALDHPLVLILTYDEELGTLGAQHLARTWHAPFPLPRSAIVGEPTELRVVRMHKGHLKMKVTFRGTPAHSGYPHLGVNAIEPAGRVVAALSRLRAALEHERSDTSGFFPEAPFVTLNLARITGGTAINIVPDRCVLDVAARPLPGMRSDGVIQRIRETVESVDARGNCTVEVVDVTPPLLTEEEAPVHRAMCRLVAQNESYGVSYASDAGAIAAMGIECILLGPGSIEVAHKPNESLPKAQFIRARELLDRAIHAFCVDDN